MLRLRLASLALASGVLFTLSGCCSFCENGQMFPRLFPSRTTGSAPHGAECECHNSFMAPPPSSMVGMSTSQGPILTQPATASTQTMPIPITNLPVTQPPQMFRPQYAPPTAYVPGPN